MELSQVRYYLALCETRNFTRAAERCRVSQPALTTGIKRLEKELGGALFFRDRAGVTLTPLGRSLFPRFQRMALDSASIGIVAENHRRLKQVPLRLGVLATIGPARIATWLRAFHGQAPGVELELHVARADELIAKLEEMEIDLLISSMGDRAPEWAVVTKLYDEGYAVLLPPGHPLAVRGSLGLKDLAGQPYVDRLACEMRDKVAAACAARKLELYAAHRTEREEWVQAFVEAGLGFAFLPEYSVQPGEAAARPLVDPPLRRTIALVRNANRPLAPAARLFWNHASGTTARSPRA